MTEERLNQGACEQVDQEQQEGHNAGLRIRPANSGGSWEPSSKKVLELQENVEPNSCTFCQ